ncbi:MAG: hypothetical protein L2C94_004120 [Aigarchaeota archaeon]|nr:hypothetical protein [Candidatus Wolframiiraptor gerlachensis]
MVRVIVFHFTEKGRLPKLSREELINIRNRFLEVLRDYPDAHFNGTHVDENGMGFCDWEASSPEIVKEVLKKAPGSEPVDPVIVVKQVLL